MEGLEELDNYPSGLDPSHGAVLLYALGVLYMFLALALVCDEYFVPSLEVLAHKLGIEEDVAGATFMAAGGSAPELATGLLGVFVSKSNVGVGTIVGSAAFNVLFVTGACAFYAKEALQLHWYPLLRDSTFYAIDLLVLALFFASGSIRWWHCTLLIALYTLYVMVVFLDRKLRPMIERWVQHRFGYFPMVEQPEQPEQLVESQIEMKRGAEGSWKRQAFIAQLKFQGVVKKVILLGTSCPVRRFQLAAEITSLQQKLQSKKPVSGIRLEVVDLQHEGPGSFPQDMYVIFTPHHGGNSTQPDDEDTLMSLHWPRAGSTKQKLFYMTKLPICALLHYTLPDVKEEASKHLFALTFAGSVAWICVFAYLMVWWTTVIGIYLGISTTVLGITLVAAGASVPDLITSLIVARKGLGDMAISSSIGSNIFDVTVGLPIPWLLHSILNGGEPSPVDDTGLGCQILVLLIMVFLTILTVCRNKWKLSRTMGLVMLIMYGAYIIMALFFELVWTPF